ncbi:MAG: hypothetical protein OK457_04295 [Thaumarchaeota archaeon]|nr:hypothetical protein [Nitrososphaerota archaeon]
MALGQDAKLERAIGTKPVSDIEFVKYNMFSIGPRVQASIRTLNELSESGAVGSPEKADRKKGEEIVEATVQKLSNLLIEFSNSKEAPSKRSFN